MWHGDNNERGSVADEVLTERHGRTLVITINRPEARNAFNLAVAQGLADAMDELDDTPSCRCRSSPERVATFARAWT